jgi:hypothetical protein
MLAQKVWAIFLIAMGIYFFVCAKMAPGKSFEVPGVVYFMIGAIRIVRYTSTPQYAGIRQRTAPWNGSPSQIRW